ncbi:hypothetical protein [Streptomyces sp. NPDC059909]|uniref:hypothetical protein n=1 Tax=Streptomyces sp. NPDC059909 TaxID=3346998 RepID=UPI003660C42E
MFAVACARSPSDAATARIPWKPGFARPRSHDCSDVVHWLMPLWAAGLRVQDEPGDEFAGEPGQE